MVIPGSTRPITRKAFHNILVAITKRSGHSTLDMAASLATPGATRVKLFHLQERIAYPNRAGHVLLETFDEAVDFASRMQAELLELGIAAEVEVGREITGHEAEQILLAAYNFNADVIVCGNHRKSGIEALLRGSTTKDLVRKTELTLVLVPEGR